jgi:hypothetical protein
VVKDDFAANRQYPVRCPACGAVAGYPTAVETIRTRPGLIRINICCHGCKTEWFQEVDTAGQ